MQIGAIIGIVSGGITLIATLSGFTWKAGKLLVQCLKLNSRLTVIEGADGDLQKRVLVLEAQIQTLIEMKNRLERQQN